MGLPVNSGQKDIFWIFSISFSHHASNFMWPSTLQQPTTARRSSEGKKVQSRYFYRHQNNYSLHQGAMCSSHIYHPVYLIFFCFRHGKNITIHLWKIYCVQFFYHFPTATKLLYPPSYFLLLEETKLLPTTERSYLITTLTFYHISLW